MSENYKFVQNRKCEYFPCHEGVKEEDFNCLFCFCPLYLLKEECGGMFQYKKSVKDCSDCTLPHGKNSHAYVMTKMKRIVELCKKES